MQTTDSTDSNASLFFDILASLFARWKLIAAVTVIFVLVGVVVSLSGRNLYAFNTVISVGTKEKGRLAAPIEPVEITVEKLVRVFVPEAQRELSLPDGATPPQLSVSAVGESIILHSVGDEGAEEAIETLHSAVVSRLQAHHSTLNKERLAELTDRRANIELVLKATTIERDHLIESRLEETDRGTAGTDVDIPDTGSTLHRQEREIELLARLFNNEFFSQRFDVLSSRLENLNKELRELQIEAARYRETFAAGVAVRSEHRSGIGSGLTLALAAVTGLIVGIVAALLQQVLAVLRRRQTRGT
ncbi:MAG: hypothetical protein JJ864_00700 [Rhizobiaceae bacterium]|nr:hypothetical protein [Rhizobiaceae bacterium]